MEEATDTRTLDEIMVAFGDLMLQHFRPVPNEGEMTQMLSTEQLLHMVNDHAPGLMPPKHFRECMLALNFVERAIDGRFMWLLADRD